MKNLVVLTGAGISRESGLKTFRDGDGLWEGHNIHDVATPEAWKRNPKLVQSFYNERRRGVIDAKPNSAHLDLVQLEKTYNVTIITQNIDDLHERAGSTNILHLHGEIMKSQSSTDPSLVYEITEPTIEMGAKCERGSQLRPHVVWFGEAVPMMDRAIKITESADIFIVIGTSLAVYPAASLLQFTSEEASLWIIDPVIPSMPEAFIDRVRIIEETAASGTKILLKDLFKN